MKKAICILLITAVLTGLFAGCKKKVYFDEEEYSQAVSESERKESESYSKQQVEISEERQELESDLGKSEKNKQLVLHVFAGDHDEYQVFFFKKGVAYYKKTYKYFDEVSYYESTKSMGETDAGKLIEKHDDTLCLVYENKDIIPMDYDTAYSRYQRRGPEYCEIIE